MLPHRALLFILLAWGLNLTPLARAANPQAETQGPVTAAAASFCPKGIDPSQHLAQGLPIDCCKGHKGICGCRAGKIVCCDGTVSKDPNCTCHADAGLEL